MNQRPRLIDDVVRGGPRQAAQPATALAPKPKELTPGNPTAPTSQRPARNIDGVVRVKPTGLSGDLAAKPMAHLQPHPLLQQPARASAQPVHPAAKAARPIGRHAPPQPASSLQLMHHDPPAATSKKPKPRPQPKLRKHWHIRKLTLFTAIIGSFFGLLSLFSMTLGEIVIGVYAVIVLWRRLPSRLTFMLVLAMFVGIMIAQILAPESGMTNNMAVYAFLLLCVGVVSLWLETWRERRL